jgi:hypothetical protein
MPLRQVKYLKLFRGPQCISVCSGTGGHVLSGAGEMVALNDAYEERWRVESIGHERAAFVTADVVVTSCVGEGLRGLAVADGRELWRRKTRFGWHHYLMGEVVFALQKEREPTLSSWRLASGTPLRKIRLPGLPVGKAAGDLLVCAPWDRGERSLRQIAAVSISGDGKRLWSASLGDDYDWLTVTDDLIVASSAGSVVVLSSTTGNRLWSHSFDEQLASWPLRHGPHLLAWTPKTISCFEAHSGRQRWEKPITRYFYNSPARIGQPSPFRDLLIWPEGGRQCLFEPASGKVVEWLHVDANMVCQAGDDLLFGGPFGELRVFRDRPAPGPARRRTPRARAATGAAAAPRRRPGSPRRTASGRTG